MDHVEKIILWNEPNFQETTDKIVKNIKYILKEEDNQIYIMIYIGRIKWSNVYRNEMIDDQKKLKFFDSLADFLKNLDYESHPRVNIIKKNKTFNYLPKQIQACTQNDTYLWKKTKI
jgi:hypothetical protein